MLFFGQTLPMAILAIVLGTGLGSLTQGVLSARGPEAGVPQMILSRVSFGYFGNALPAGLNAVIAGIGWFAVNSVSGTFALNTLTHIPKLLSPAHRGASPRSRSPSWATTSCTPSSAYAFPFLVVAFVLAAIVIIPKATRLALPAAAASAAS